MPFLILFSAVALIPAALAMPVPQTVYSGLTSPSGRPTGVASMGGLSSTITLEGPPPNDNECKSWQSCGYGNNGGYQNPGYGSSQECKPWRDNCYNNNGGYNNPGAYGNPPFNANPCRQYDRNCRDGSEPSPSSEAGTAIISTSSNGISSSITTRDEPKPPSRGGGYTKGRDGQPRPGVTTSATSGPLMSLSGKGGIGSHPSDASFGGLESSITLGEKSKRQTNDNVLTDGVATLSGLESILSTGIEADNSGLESSITFESKTKRQTNDNVLADGVATLSGLESTLSTGDEENAGVLTSSIIYD